VCEGLGHCMACRYKCFLLVPAIAKRSPDKRWRSLSRFTQGSMPDPEKLGKLSRVPLDVGRQCETANIMGKVILTQR
jgi:hypothetical protein